MPTSTPTLKAGVKAVFLDMIKKGILWGVKPIFDDHIDLEVNDPTMKTLILRYIGLSDSDVYSRPIRTIFPDMEYVSEFEFRDRYPMRFPFLTRTFLDHWRENEKALKEPMWLKFGYFYIRDRTEAGIRAQRERQKRKIQDDLKEAGYDPVKTLLVPLYEKVEENIGEFISLMFFRSKGFLTTSFVPSTGVRIPDVTCWKTPVLNELKDRGLMEHGTTLYELQMLRILKKIESNRTGDLDGNSVVIEVESDAWGSGIGQLLGTTKGYTYKEGYVEGGSYDKGFIMCPFECKSDDRIGVLSFDEKGLYFQDCPKSFARTERKQLSLQEIDDLIKMTLLANFTFEEISELVSTCDMTYFQVLKQVANLKAETIIDRIGELLVS